MAALLEVTDLDVYYGMIQAVRKVSLEVNSGEMVCVIGANGAGKTTLLRTISGLLRCKDGDIRFKGELINELAPHVIVRKGIIHVPEGRGIFPSLNLEQNLLMGAYARKDANIGDSLKNVFELFPWMKERKRQPGGNLSGGEQQMLAIARGLMAKPELLLMDEPSLGLSPLIIREIVLIIKGLQEQGITILLVEQNAKQALKIADRAYVLANGEMVMTDSTSALLKNENVLKVYLGGR